MPNATSFSSRPIPVPLTNADASSAHQLACRSKDPAALPLAVLKVDTVVAVCDTHEQAVQAVRALQAAGVEMRSLSIAGKDTHLVEHVSGYYTAGDRMLHWGSRGAFWGGIWGLLFDSALFALPGIGSVLLAGPLVSWIVAILEGAVVFGGLSALAAGLVSIGIPHHSVIEYETALKTDKFLVIVHGASKSVAKAREAFNKTPHVVYTVHGENVLAS